MDADFEIRRRRRGLFGGAASDYGLGRPGYPDGVYDLLRRRGLAPGSSVLEVGPGTGQATEALLELGATVTAVELAPEFAAGLRSSHPSAALDVIVGAFEDVDVAPGSFDFLVSATAFHWVPTEPGLARAAAVLRPGGWLALWWTVFGDEGRDDPFHDAIQPLLTRHAPELLVSPGSSGAAGSLPYALDVDARRGEIDRSAAFGPVRHEIFPWTGRHSAVEIRAMFASFSNWLAVEPGRREPLLDELERLATVEFGGLVERPYRTAVYLAERTPGDPVRG